MILCTPKCSPFAWSQRRHSKRELLKRLGLNSIIYLAVDAMGRPVLTFVTANTTAGCRPTFHLMIKLDAMHPTADREYDRNAIVADTEAQGRATIISPSETDGFSMHTNRTRMSISILLKMYFFISNNGWALQRVGLKMHSASSPPSSSNILHCSFVTANFRV